MCFASTIIIHHTHVSLVESSKAEIQHLLVNRHHINKTFKMILDTLDLALAYLLSLPETTGMITFFFVSSFFSSYDNPLTLSPTYVPLPTLQLP